MSGRRAREIAVDPHTFPWDEWLEEPESGDTDHTPTPTYEIHKTTTYTLGRHTITRTYRVITNHKGESK